MNLFDVHPHLVCRRFCFPFSNGWVEFSRCFELEKCNAASFVEVRSDSVSSEAPACFLDAVEIDLGFFGDVPFAVSFSKEIFRVSKVECSSSGE